MKLNDDIIFKAQAKAELARPKTGTAALLVFGGLALLVASLAGIDLLGVFAPLIFVGGLGVLMLLPAHNATAEQPTSWGFLAIPGAFFLTLGTLIFMMGLVNHFEAFAYAWALLPASVIVGLMYMKRFDEAHSIHHKGPRALRFFISAFMVMALFFELLVFQTLGPWWPLLLIGTGAFMLWKREVE